MSRISFRAVGDICPGDMAFPGLGICSQTMKYGVKFPFEKVGKIFNDADIVIGNLEGMLSNAVLEKGPGNLRFCGLPSFAAELKRRGFNVINVANNHVLEHGADIFLESVKILKDAGIQVCGLRGNGKYYSQPVFLHIESMRIGVIGYNWIGVDNFENSDKYIAQSRDSIVNYTWHRNEYYRKLTKDIIDKKNVNVINDIHSLKQEVDFIVLVTHWGYEHINYPPIGVTLEAKSFIDAGADLIIGSHPHLLHGMEVYKGKCIFYSMGNFLFDMKSSRARSSAVLKYSIDYDKSYDWEFVPYRLNNLFQPSPASEKQSREINNIINISNRIISSEQKYEMLDDNKLYKEHVRQYHKGKYLTFLHLVKASLVHPKMIKIILKKLTHTIILIMRRLSGDKVRW